MDHAVTAHPGQTLFLCIAIALSAVATVVATERGWKRGVYVFKPLTTLLIVALALRQDAIISGYRTLIVAGLVFSLAGDVLLMLPRDRFVAGLVAFLAAHLLYIAAFADLGFGATWWIILPLAVYAAVLLRVLLPHVGRALKVPVIVYSAALLVMAWQAAERAATAHRIGAIAPFLATSGALATAGAVLFVASDSALAVNRFVRQFRGADAVVLATYFAAQTLIALSIR
ncbi:MAG TPA: lysoplasmalogenase [Longimicrobiaceae bacterium]